MRLVVEKLRKRFGGRRVLEEVSFSCPGGSALALLGPNGSGKSTLLRILAGILEPDDGTASLDGEPLVGPGARARRRMGYLPEASEPLPPLSPAELAGLAAALRRVPPPPAALAERLGLADCLDRRLEALSLGQRRRAGLFTALVGPPDLLLLDEPSEGLDAAGATMLGEVLRERVAAGALCLLATHDLALARALGAQELRLRDGRLEPAGAEPNVASSPAER